MANILINGLKSKTGGGKSIFDNYLELLRKNGHSNVYYVLTPDKSKYNLKEPPHIRIIEITGIFKSNAFFPILYSRIFPRLIRKYKIDAIFNLGDIIIPTAVPQLYLFQWAYAVYPETGVWDRMGPLSYLTRRTKVKLISKYINYPSIVIAQTINIKERLESVYGLKNVVIVPNAVSLENIAVGEPMDFNLPKEKIKLVYVANWAEHKNIEILVPLALKIAESSLPFCIVVTIRPDQNNGAQQFLERVRKFKLNDIIINIGNVPMENIGSLYQQCDALLMPTLLESYGLPYIEALYHKKTILTSDMDFAHDVCGDAAFYFNPHDPADILDTIREASDNQCLRELKIKQGQEQLSDLLSWDQVFARYQQLLQETITSRNA